MQMIRITELLHMRGTRTGSLSAVCSSYIKNGKDALKSVYPLSLAVNGPLRKILKHKIEVNNNPWWLAPVSFLYDNLY